MKKFAPLLALYATLCACAPAAYVSPVEVTRFTGESNAQLAQGTIEIAAAPNVEAEALEYGAYRAALENELTALGYQVVSANGDQVAMISIAQFIAEPASRGRGNGVGVGVGGSTGSYGSGVGMGVGLDLTRLLSGPDPERIEREVAVSIRPAAGGQNLWEGRASMAATSNSDYAEEDVAARRIVDALFIDFPGTSGETIAVE